LLLKEYLKKDKLIKLTVSFSKKEGDEITVVTNLGEFYEPDDFATFLPIYC
jgi:tRNA-binding EMAP/Myf-like protein